MQTTLNKIRQHSPCQEGWTKLLKYLNKTKADDEPLSLLTIINSNGLDDTLWCMRAVDGYDKEIRLYAVWCARQVQHLMTDERSVVALDVAEKFANGEVTEEYLNAANDAARAVSEDANNAASIARAVSEDAWDIAMAASDTEWDIAWDAWDAARAVSDTTNNAARVASIARAVSDTTNNAARVASIARAVSEDALAAQEKELRRILSK